MEVEIIYSILIGIISFLVGLVIKLISNISKANREHSIKTTKDMHDVTIKVELILEKISNNIDNVNDLKESLLKFREDLTYLQLDIREIKVFKTEMIERINKLEKQINDEKI